MKVRKTWKGVRLGDVVRVLVPANGGGTGLAGNLLVFGELANGTWVANPCMGRWSTPELLALDSTGDGTYEERARLEEQRSAVVKSEIDRFDALAQSTDSSFEINLADVARARCGKLDAVAVAKRASAPASVTPRGSGCGACTVGAPRPREHVVALAGAFLALAGRLLRRQSWRDSSAKRAPSC